MNGILYGVGLGPGDPELLTLKAVKIIEHCAVIAVPEAGSGRRLALEIAGGLVAGKEIIACPAPMTRDAETLKKAHNAGAEMIAARLSNGEDVAYLTLGDVSIYSTFSYLQRLLEADGYETRIIPGVPSFAAAAAALKTPLCTGNAQLHISPADTDSLPELLKLPGTKILMKSGSKTDDIISALDGRRASLVENCGLENERVFHDIRDYSGGAGYFTLIILKDD